MDSGGKVLNNIGGRVDDKRAYLARCKFTIAFENESHPGYATEKTIEPLLMGSIPIYWGDPHIDEDFNPECFINVHRFKCFDDVVDEVRRIDQDEKLWQQYVTAPIFKDDVLPELLTDDAIHRFCLRVFSEKTPRIPRVKKTLQMWVEAARQSRTMNLVSAASASIRPIFGRPFRRVKKLLRARLGMKNGYSNSQRSNS